MEKITGYSLYYEKHAMLVSDANIHVICYFYMISCIYDKVTIGYIDTITSATLSGNYLHNTTPSFK